MVIKIGHGFSICFLLILNKYTTHDSISEINNKYSQISHIDKNILNDINLQKNNIINKLDKKYSQIKNIDKNILPNIINNIDAKYAQIVQLNKKKLIDINLQKNTIINDFDNNYIKNAQVEKKIIKNNYFNKNNIYANIKNSFPDINDNGNIFDNIKNDLDKYNLNLKNNNLINDTNLDNLIFNINQIPTYQCCKASIGPLINFDFSNLEIILKNINKCYKLMEERGNILYITDPYPYNENIGLYIRNVIKDDNINYIMI